MMAAGIASAVDDVRGYGPEVVERLRGALEQNCPARPDPLHPYLFVLECAGENFYIAPLPTGTILLLARWPI
jgi:hypothetical protein